MYFNGNGENLFCFKKSYKFCSSISNTRHVWFLCWKHSNARTKLNSSAFSWLRRERIDTSIWPCRAYEGWFLRILMATISFVPFFQHFTTWPNVPRPRNSRTYEKEEQRMRISDKIHTKFYYSSNDKNTRVWRCFLVPKFIFQFFPHFIAPFSLSLSRNCSAHKTALSSKPSWELIESAPFHSQCAVCCFFSKFIEL